MKIDEHELHRKIFFQGHPEVLKTVAEELEKHLPPPGYMINYSFPSILDQEEAIKDKIMMYIIIIMFASIIYSFALAFSVEKRLFIPLFFPSLGIIIFLLMKIVEAGKQTLYNDEKKSLLRKLIFSRNEKIKICISVDNFNALVKWIKIVSKGDVELYQLNEIIVSNIYSKISNNKIPIRFSMHNTKFEKII